MLAVATAGGTAKAPTSAVFDALRLDGGVALLRRRVLQHVVDLLGALVAPSHLGRHRPVRRARFDFEACLSKGVGRGPRHRLVEAGSLVRREGAALVGMYDSAFNSRGGSEILTGLCRSLDCYLRCPRWDNRK